MGQLGNKVSQFEVMEEQPHLQVIKYSNIVGGKKLFAIEHKVKTANKKHVICEGIPTFGDAEYILEALLGKLRMEKITKVNLQLRLDQEMHEQNPFQCGVTNGIITALANIHGQTPPIYVNSTKKWEVREIIEGVEEEIAEKDADGDEPAKPM